MTSRSTAAILAKEFRALLPTWMACALTIAGAAVLEDFRFRIVPVYAFVIGCLALGAQSIGHEYTHRTLPLLLSLPVARWRVLALKALVLAALLLPLGLLGWRRMAASPVPTATSLWQAPEIWWLTLACGLFVAPWLTMVARRPLAGVVFTMALGGSFVIAGEAIGAVVYGAQDPLQIDRFRHTFFLRGMSVAVVVAGILSVRAFLRLEAVDGQAADIDVARWVRWRVHTRDEPETRRRSPVRALIEKELRLQQMPAMIAVLYVALWAALALVEYRTPTVQGPPFDAIALLYIAFLSFLSGSLASAEERQLGTVESQLLLPIAAATQWTIKVIVVLTLPLVLGVALTFALAATLTFGIESRLASVLFSDDGRNLVRFTITMTGASLASSIGGLYVSSLCSSGLRALVVSPLATFSTLALGAILGEVSHGLAVRLILPAFGRTRGPGLATVAAPLSLALAGGFLCLVLWLAFVNHRSVDRRAARIAQQLTWIVGYLAVGITALTVLSVI
jgi:hypothetical protein